MRGHGPTWLLDRGAGSNPPLSLRPGPGWCRSPGARCRRPAAGGGRRAAARAYRLPPHPGFAFPQQQNPALAPAGWRPRFVDYLYLGFTNATAFSPTDAMPLVPWAKVAMALQSFISMGLLALVVARAVHIFT